MCLEGMMLREGPLQEFPSAGRVNELVAVVRFVQLIQENHPGVRQS